MNFNIYQTVKDGTTLYSSSDAPVKYSATVELSFCGVKTVLLNNGAECYTMFFERRVPVSQRVLSANARTFYPVNFYKTNVRIGSVKPKRFAFLGRSRFELLLEKRVFSVLPFSRTNNRAQLYMYEDGALCAKISRESQTNGKTTYSVWVNDEKYLPKPDPNDPIETVPAAPNTYAEHPEIKFWTDAAALFTVCFDIAALKPFGEFKYAANKQQIKGLKSSAARYNCEHDYNEIVNPPAVVPEQIARPKRERVHNERTSGGLFSKKSIIAREDALASALSEAATTQDRVNDLEVEYEKDDAVYEVEFELEGKEYKYDIDAKTGAVKKLKLKRADD